MSPAALTRGATTAVTVTGSGFIHGAHVVIDGGGIRIDNVAIVGPYRIAADVTVAADARPGARTVFVVLAGAGEGPGTGALAFCNCVTVN